MIFWSKCETTFFTVDSSSKPFISIPQSYLDNRKNSMACKINVGERCLHGTSLEQQRKKSRQQIQNIQHRVCAWKQLPCRPFDTHSVHSIIKCTVKNQTEKCATRERKKLKKLILHSFFLTILFETFRIECDLRI